MLYRHCCAFFAIYLGTAYAQAQQAPTPDVVPPPSTPTRTDPDKRGARPLTPVEERERAIRRFDPRNGADSLEREQDTGLLSPRPDPRTAQGSDPRVSAAPRPLPGSVAASGQSDFVSPRSPGPQVVDPTQSDSAEPTYNGPAVLSRNYTLSRPNIPREIKWTPTLGISETFISGQNGVPIAGATGTTPYIRPTWGTSVYWGISGRHLWKRNQISADYHGNATQSAGGQAFNGGNHSLDFQFAHVLSRHMIASLSQSFSSTSQSYSLQAGLGPATNSVANSNLALSPGLQPIDQGLRQMSTLGSLRWQKSARIAVSMSGGVFFVNRRAVVVGGTTGYQAQADVTYRYSRKATVGVYYSHTNYLFSRHTSVSSSDTMGGIFSYAFNRATQFRLRAGSATIESQTLAFIPFPAQLALILGQAGGIEMQFQNKRLQDISAEFAKDLGRSKTASVSYARGLSPGNGILLTSSHEALNASLAIPLPVGFRGTLTAGGDRLSAVGSVSGSFSSRQIQFAMFRRHSHGMTSNYSIDFRNLNYAVNFAPQQQIRITTGVTWGPGENRLWK